jgi:hypothetical protein
MARATIAYTLEDAFAQAEQTISSAEFFMLQIEHIGASHSAHRRSISYTYRCSQIVQNSEPPAAHQNCVCPRILVLL